MGIYTAAVQKLYVAYFNRPADTLGLAFWEAQVTAANGSTAAVSNAFAASKEYADTYAGMSTAARVDAIYNNLFGRGAEPAGLQFWGLAIDQGKVTVAAAVTAIAAGAQGTDLVAYNNKVAAATAFTVALDTSAEIVAYSGAAANNAAKTWLSGVTTDATLTTATATAALNASVAGVVAAAVVVTAPVAFTTGADTINGTSGNDVFNASEIAGVSAWTVGDKLDGGLGSDVLNVTQTAAITAPVGATVTGVETINLTSGTTGNSINSSSFTGLTALNVSGVTAQTVAAAATTAISVTSSAATGAVVVNGGSTVAVTTTGANGGTIGVGATTAAAGAVTVTSTGTAAGGTTGNAITVNGGTTIGITQIGGNAVNTTNTSGAVTVIGTAATTAVTVTGTKIATASATVAGQVANSVQITDVNTLSATAAGTIASANVSNYTTLNFAGTALTNLSVTGGSGNIIIDNSGLTTATNKTLGLTVNGLTGGTLDDADIYTTLNVTGSGSSSTLANITFGAATTLNVDGAAAVKVTSVAGLGALTAVTSTNTAGLTLGSAIGTGVTFTGGAGADSVSLGATTKAITMGAGNDTVTSAGLVGTGGSVDAGDGEDTIVMSGAEADVADNSATFNTKFKNFEVLSVTTGATETFDVAGINNVSKITTIGANGLTVNNIATGATLTLTGAGTALTMGIANATFNAADVLNIVAQNSTAGAVAFGSVTAASVETVNISLQDTGKDANVAATIDTATLVGTSTTKIVVSGNNGLTLTNTGNVKVTTFDASGVVANGATDTAANLAVSFTSANTTVGASITITGGAGNDVLAGNALVVNSNTITGGEGADTITSGLGNDSIILTETTAAIDTVIFGDTADNGIDTITGFAAGTGIDLARLVSGVTTNAAQASAGIADFGASTNTTLTLGAAAFALTGANSTTDDIVEINATLSSFGNLAAVGVVDGTELLKALSSVNVAATSITATTAGDDFYLVGYQNGNAYLYQVVNDGDANVVAAEIALVGVFNGVAAGAFVAGDFTV